MGDQNHIDNVELIQAMPSHNLPRASFDLVHVRFMFTPPGRAGEHYCNSSTGSARRRKHEPYMNQIKDARGQIVV